MLYSFICLSEKQETIEFFADYNESVFFTEECSRRQIEYFSINL